MILWIILGAFALFSYIVSSTLKNKFKKYSQIPLPISGAQVAERMLRQNGITDVKILQTNGSLTDFYNPSNKTVNLSEDVYSQCTVAAAAVAAHETGHALQHAQGYSALSLRTALVPLLNISNTVLNVIFIASFVLAFIAPTFLPWPVALRIIIGAYVVITLFSFITLAYQLGHNNIW